MVLRKFKTPASIMETPKAEIVEFIEKTSKRGKSSAQRKYEKLEKATQKLAS